MTILILVMNKLIKAKLTKNPSLRDGFFYALLYNKNIKGRPRGRPFIQL